MIELCFRSSEKIETHCSNGEEEAEHTAQCRLIASKPRTASRPVVCRPIDVPSQNEPLLSCRIQSSRYRKALVFHNHILEISEDPEQLQCHYEMRDLLVAVVWRSSKSRASKSENIAGAKNLGTKVRISSTGCLYLTPGSREHGINMESLSDTIWDVVLSGTGLSQSLLAL